MDNTLRKLKKALRNEFPTAELELKRDWYPAKIGGIVIWRGFAGKEQRDRQARLWSLIRSNLNKAEQDEIAMILAFSPSERKFMLEELELQSRIG